MIGMYTRSLPRSQIRRPARFQPDAIDLSPARVCADRRRLSASDIGPGPRATAGGRTIAFTGEAPKRVAMIEGDSLEQAQAFFGSAAFRNLAPQRDKAIRFLRAYAVEATSN